MDIQLSAACPACRCLSPLPPHGGAGEESPTPPALLGKNIDEGYHYIMKKHYILAQQVVVTVIGFIEQNCCNLARVTNKLTFADAA